MPVSFYSPHVLPAGMCFSRLLRPPLPDHHSRSSCIPLINWSLTFGCCQLLCTAPLKAIPSHYLVHAAQSSSCSSDVSLTRRRRSMEPNRQKNFHSSRPASSGTNLGPVVNELRVHPKLSWHRAANRPNYHTCSNQNPTSPFLCRLSTCECRGTSTQQPSETSHCFTFIQKIQKLSFIRACRCSGVECDPGVICTNWTRLDTRC